ncbi:50S ribosomal protein L21 chloroplastic [Tripterygium wilfordii]|uniref:50S ribosomal protein L21 chloroplastic n=1 Tax=Tripterygium wilfordii TaxID=458696 RepID=A0A7J7BUN2_TRIWF|nr:50S ribosomal protein L21, chloroplastic [Tripterygium wilfordii]KAF5725610.1 50S ribosomal protein L21 chloroplastic [Tripterygium wilfordii]
MASSATSTATLALCSSFQTHCNISHHRNQPQCISLSNTQSSFLSKTHHLLSTRSALPLIPKFSSSDAPVLEAEAKAEVGAEPEPTQIVETAEEKPKREEIFAVVMIGGRQYIVFPGRFLYVQRLKGANVNDKITLNRVLLVGKKDITYIGKPVVTNAVVEAVVEEQGLDPKVIVFKYKKKKNYRRNIGHRQPNSRIRITAITGYQDYPATTLDDEP